MNTRVRPLALGALLIGSMAAPAAAQRIDPLGVGAAQGATIRLTGPMIPGGSVTGWLVRWSADSVTVATQGGPQQFSRTGLSKLEVGRGRDRPLWAVLGGVAGIAAAAIKVRIAPTDDYDDLALAILLPVVGSGIGALAAPERWRSLTVRSLDRAVGLGFRVRF